MILLCLRPHPPSCAISGVSIPPTPLSLFLFFTSTFRFVSFPGLLTRYWQAIRRSYRFHKRLPISSIIPSAVQSFFCVLWPYWWSRCFLVLFFVCWNSWNCGLNSSRADLFFFSRYVLLEFRFCWWRFWLITFYSPRLLTRQRWLIDRLQSLAAKCRILCTLS